MGCNLQRLFSTFPNSWPGLGLLVLRLSLAAALVYESVPVFSVQAAGPAAFVQFSIAVAGIAFLLVGLWTPVMGVLVAVNEAWIAIILVSQPAEHKWLHLLLAALALSVAMLGPGAWSIDARMFGRRRLDIDRGRGRRQ